MTTGLRAFIAEAIAAPVQPEIAQAAHMLANHMGGIAVLFYGSILRTGDLDGVLDFYVLCDDAKQSGLRASRWGLWPDVSFHELDVGGRILRAKVATIPIGVFRKAAQGRLLDTTIWARFVQPCALIWTRGESEREAVEGAVCAAAVTAARFAAALGPERGTPRDYWKALFSQTYRAELRVENPGREDQILVHEPMRYDRLLPLAWEADGIKIEREGVLLTPKLSRAKRRSILANWKHRRRMGKPLNIARLIKAAFTFDGAARYGLWKIERHTGLAFALTPWRERHPILAAPRVLWRVWRARRTR